MRAVAATSAGRPPRSSSGVTTPPRDIRCPPATRREKRMTTGAPARAARITGARSQGAGRAEEGDVGDLSPTIRSLIDEEGDDAALREGARDGAGRARGLDEDDATLGAEAVPGAVERAVREPLGDDGERRGEPLRREPTRGRASAEIPVAGVGGRDDEALVERERVANGPLGVGLEREA